MTSGSARVRREASRTRSPGKRAEFSGAARQRCFRCWRRPEGPAAYQILWRNDLFADRQAGFNLHLLSGSVDEILHLLDGIELVLDVSNDDRIPT